MSFAELMEMYHICKETSEEMAMLFDFDVSEEWIEDAFGREDQVRLYGLLLKINQQKAIK